MYSPSVIDILKPYQQYPRTIQRAILLVETNPRFLGLTRAMKAVFKALLTRASQHDGTTSINARVDRLALQANVSEKTVQRTLATVRHAGWLEQVSEGRSEWGNFTYRSYRFTIAVCQMLQLPIKGKKVQETKLSDGAIYVDLSFKRDHAEISKEKRQGKAIDLPAVLQEIAALGIKETGVAKLRGMAHNAGHRLEDIWKTGKARIVAIGAIGGRLYRYLQAMIAKVSDYAARAQQVERCAAKAATTVPKLANRAFYAHKRFVGKAGTNVRIFDGMAEVVRDGEWIGNIAGLDMEQVYRDIEAGILKPDLR